jgi:hypothetical protein
MNQLGTSPAPVGLENGLSLPRCLSHISHLANIANFAETSYRPCWPAVRLDLFAHVEMYVWRSGEHESVDDDDAAFWSWSSTTCGRLSPTFRLLASRLRGKRTAVRLDYIEEDRIDIRRERLAEGRAWMRNTCGLGESDGT